MNIKQVLLGVGALVALGLVLTSTSSEQNANLLGSSLIGEFASFKSQFRKEYGSPSEHTYRMGVFATNLELIKKHNSRNDVTYSLAVNQFTDLTFAEFKEKYLMSSMENKMTEDCDFESQRISNDDPKTVDWDAQGKVRAAKDQARCGSCWAFATIGSVESAIAIKGSELPNLSEQELVDCSGLYGNDGCNGGFPSWALAYIIDKGINTEASYPYTATDGMCAKNKDVNAKISSCKKIDEGVDNLIPAIVKQPVAVAFYVQNDFRFYKSGVYNPEYCDGQINHAVLAVGYDLTASVNFFKIKNSWGQGWGEKGFFKMATGSGDGTCNIAGHQLNSYPVV